MRVLWGGGHVPPRKFLPSDLLRSLLVPFWGETARVGRPTAILVSLVPRPPPFLAIPSVCVHNNTRERKTGENFVDLPIPYIIVNANERSKRRRPGTEASLVLETF